MEGGSKTAVSAMRQQAALALVEILDRGGFASLVIDHTLKNLDAERKQKQLSAVEERDRRFFSSLIYEVVRHRETIDGAIAAVSKTPLKKIRPYVLACMRLGVAQLWYMEGVKPYAAISESVELVKKAGFRGLAPYVNGVLRSVQRQGKPAEEAVSFLPEWIEDSLTNDYGETWTKSLINAMKTVRPTCFRLNALKMDELKEKEKRDGVQEYTQEQIADLLLKELRKTAPDAEMISKGHLCKDALYVRHPGNIGAFSWYQQGLVSVQDESSMAAVMALDPQKGERVLDLCAAPGGKSAYIAERMENEGEVVSRDIHPHRVKLIEDGARRLGLTVIQAEVSDASALKKEDAEGFDRVLLDAPCSGWGILRSKRDIADNHSPEAIEGLPELQRKMLRSAQAALKKGGRLVYSTCTLRKAENEEQIRWFLKEYPEFELVDLKEVFPRMTEEDGILDQTMTLRPVQEGHDGFFVAALQKNQ